MSTTPLNHIEDLIKEVGQLVLTGNYFVDPNYNRIHLRRPFDRFFTPSATAGYLRNYKDRAIGSRITTEDDNKFRVNIDVQHFAPDEVSVKVVDGFVVVEGKHEEKCDEHGYVSRQFVRRFKLPRGCLPDTVESQLSSDGVLSVTSPKVLALPSKGEKIVPITYTG